MKGYMLYHEGKLLAEFKAKDYTEAKKEVLEIVTLSEVEE